MTTSTAAAARTCGGWPAHPLASIKEQHMPDTTDPQPALRDRIADALADAEGWQWAPGFDKSQSPTYQHYLRQADAVVAVLPAPADRAAILLWAAERFDARAAAIADVSDNPAIFVAKDRAKVAGVWTEGAAELRRMADEAPANIQCTDAFWTKRPHAPHDWQQRPDSPLVHCPGVDGEAQQPETQADGPTVLLELVRDFLDPDPCSFDHHGYCKAHGYLGGEPGSCPHGRARKLLAAIDAEPAPVSQPDDGPPAPLRRSWDDCPGFPEKCPNLRPVDPDPPTHLGGIRCGCADKEPTQ